MIIVLSSVSANMEEATAVGFLDRFGRHEQDLWILVDNQSVCIQGFCVYATSDNVEYLRADNSALQLHTTIHNMRFYL